jgi:nicotinate phosphoribosyltransferase
MTGQHVDVDADTIIDIHRAKANFFKMNAIKFADFGTRRAYSAKNQHNVVKAFIDYAGDSFIGTSNVELACAYNTKVLGTYAHEFVSAHASMFGYAHPNRHAMETWVSVYNGNLGIALPDTFTTDAFIIDFDTKYANLFNGVRHDSGDPCDFIDKMIEHYKKLGIDPTTKSIVFSDGLNIEEVKKLEAYRPREIRRQYGIGTYFTNDLPGIKPMNIVIKLVECDGLPAIKISDNPKKAIGDKKTIEFALWQVTQRITASKQ